MTRKVPDRLSAWPGPFHVKDHPLVRVSLDGVEYTGRVVEYCISKGWARVLMMDDHGTPKPGAIPGQARVRFKHARRIHVWFATDPVPPGALLSVEVVSSVEIDLPDMATP